MLTWLSRCLKYVSNSRCPLKFVIAALFGKLASLCLPSVSLTRPLSPLLSPCSCLQLLLGLISSSAPPCSTAESSWVLLFWKECASMWLPKGLSGDLGGQSPKMWFWTSFAPRSDLVRTSLKLQPVKTQPGEVLGRLCHGLLLALLLLLLLLLLVLLLGKARFLGGKPSDLWRAGSCAEETKSIRKLPEKIDPISGMPWKSGWKDWLAWSRIYYRNHRNATVYRLEMPWNLVCHAEDDSW